MGKRSFANRMVLVGLITLLLFIVLSTSTYAWYSANNVAGAGTIVFRSSSSDVGGFLTVGKTKTATENTITFDTPGEISPMIPTVDGIIGMTQLGQFMQFQKTYEGLDSAGQQLVAMLDGTATTPLLLAVDKQKYFYLNNVAPQTDITVKVEYIVDGRLAEKLHIAMFTGEREEDAVLMGIISGSGVIHYGKIQIGDVVGNQPTMENAYRMTGSMTFTVPAQSSVCIRLAAWLDGVDMKNENGNKTTSFSLSFKEVN